MDLTVRLDYLKTPMSCPVFMIEVQKVAPLVLYYFYKLNGLLSLCDI